MLGRYVYSFLMFAERQCVRLIAQLDHENSSFALSYPQSIPLMLYPIL